MRQLGAYPEVEMAVNWPALATLGASLPRADRLHHHPSGGKPPRHSCSAASARRRVAGSCRDWPSTPGRDINHRDPRRGIAFSHYGFGTQQDTPLLFAWRGACRRTDGRIDARSALVARVLLPFLLAPVVACPDSAHQTQNSVVA